MKSRMAKLSDQSIYNWETAVASTRSLHGKQYAIMMTVTGKERRLVLHLGDDLTKRMKWRRGDRLNILVCRTNNVIALKRSVGDEPGMVLNGKAGDKLRVQFHCKTREIVAVTERVILQMEDLTFNGDMVIFSMDFIN
jgi:hypothetical protein